MGFPADIQVYTDGYGDNVKVCSSANKKVCIIDAPSIKKLKKYEFGGKNSDGKNIFKIIDV